MVGGKSAALFANGHFSQTWNPDLLRISWSQYGGKTGIWRFMRILDETGIPATVCLNAKGAELFPEAVKELNARGHEIAGHSYTQGFDPSLPLA